MEYLTKGVLIIGMFLLLGALLPIGLLIVQVRRKIEMRIKWAILACFILFAIAGYFVYTFNTAPRGGLFDIIVPATFFLGASFVWLITMVSLQTANDVRRTANLEAENVTDPLMGIYNRRFLDKRIKEEVARAQRFDLSLSAFLIGVDNLGRINDTLGYNAGDTVLRNLAKLIMGSSRSTDLVARYEGDKICLVATNTSSQVANIIAERLCTLVNSSTLITPEEAEKSEVPRVTVSIGFAIRSGNEPDIATILALAEKAMKQAKFMGRNYTVAAQQSLFDDFDDCIEAIES